MPYTRIILYTRFTLKEPSHIARANFIATFRMIQIDPTYITIYRTGDVELSGWWSLPGRHYTFTWTKYASLSGSTLCWHYVYPKEMCKPLPSFFFKCYCYTMNRLFVYRRLYNSTHQFIFILITAPIDFQTEVYITIHSKQNKLSKTKVKFFEICMFALS